MSECVPVSIMEAQSFGLPVIATDVGGTREVMTNTNGILLSSYPTIAEVADAMDQIFYNQFNRKVIKESWKKISDADLNYSTFVKQLSILT